MDSTFMNALTKFKRETEEEMAVLDKAIEKIEQAGLWRKFLRPYLNYLKRKRDKLRRQHFRYSFPEMVGRAVNPELAAKVFFGAFKD